MTNANIRVDEHLISNRPQVDESKVQEMRDRLAKKLNNWADRIQVSMTYTPKIERAEGEIWEENGKKWTVKNGIKQNITMFDSVRMPWWCPRCTKPMNHRFDRKFYTLRGWCYNCNIDIDTEMIARRDGTWERFCKQHMRANEVAQLKDKIAEHRDYIDTFKEPQIHFEDGRWEILANKAQFKELFETLENDIEFCLGRLEQIAKEEVEENAHELVNKST